MNQQVARIGCGLALLLGIALPASAQDKPMAFERLSLEQGLSQSSVLSVFQDARGFMWFGTEDGLNRYDGFSFTTYKYDPTDTSSLPNNMVWSIAEDREGDLWIATEGGGVARWDRHSDRFVRFGRPAGGSGGLSMRARTLHVADDGALWIGAKDAGLVRLDPRSGETQHYRNDPSDPASLSHDGVYAIVPDRAGRLWVGTDGGLNRLDPATGKFVRYLHDSSRSDTLSDNRVRAIFEDRDGRIWVGTFGGGLNRLDTATERFRRFRHDPAQPFSLVHDRVRTILEDNAGRLWIGTDGGLDLMDRQRSVFQHYTNNPADPAGLADSNVMSLYQDRGGLLWVGTRSGGAHKWNPATWSFGHRTRMASGSLGLGDKMVTSFAEDRTGRIWIGTFGAGLHTMDRQTGEIRRLAGGKAAGLSDRVMRVATDQQGLLWVGTMDAGLSRLDPTTGRVTTYRHDPLNPKSLSADGVMTIAFDNAGDLWVGTHGGGLNRFDSSTGTFLRYLHDPKDPKSLGGEVVTSLLHDKSGALWVGTDGGGLNLFDRKSGGFIRFGHDPSDATSLGSDSVFALYQGSDGRLWLGTRGAGLAVMESRSGSSASFKHYTRRDGLSNDVVYGIVPDGDGDLWLSTNNGLSCFDPRSGSFRNYDDSHGLQSREFNFGAHYRSASGELFFGGINGLNAFNPQQLATNGHVPQVALTSLLLNNKEVQAAKPLWQTDGIDLGYRDHIMTLEFAALDYAAPQRNRYAHRLEGFESEWVELGNLRRVTYTNLPPGTYRFRVRAANNDGVWNENGLDLPITVEAPPWRRWWAYAGYLLSLGGAVVGFVRVQSRKLEREAEYSRRLESEVEQRTLELAGRNADLEAANKQLAEASLTDSLTGLRNRRFLFEHVSKDVDLVRRRYLALRDGSAAPTFDLSFVMIDLDHFKVINDTCGHAAGDAVLRGVREVLQSCCRHSDVLIRWGGDEFLLVGRDNDPEQVSVLAERLRSEIEAAAFEIGEGRVARTTCSIGYSCYPLLRTDPELHPWEDVLGLADAALYAAKGKRNTWVGYLSTQQPLEGPLARTERSDQPGELLESGALHAVSSNPELQRGVAPARLPHPRPDRGSDLPEATS
jgi:diguanylate cyclase (GGDEF)-like protein